jgi:hypothetical protein
MARVQLPPQTEPLVDEDKFPTLNYASFFDGLATGDTGTIWTPTFVGLTEVGTAIKTGIYFRQTSKLAYFRITITPATSTTAVLGTTYCDNFPLTITSDGAANTVSGFTAATAGITASNKRIYTAAWAAIVTPIIITGTIEVS